MPTTLPKIQFKPQQAKPIRTHLNILLFGGANSGKSLTALKLANGLSKPGNIGVIDTESGRICEYSDEAPFDRTPFQVITLADNEREDIWMRCHPERILQAYEALVAAGCTTIIIDSLSDVWTATLGFRAHLEEKYRMPAKAAGDAFGIFDRVHDKMLNASVHLIATCKETVDVDQATRKTTAVAKLRGKAEFNYDFNLRMEDAGSKATVTKSPIAALYGKVLQLPTAEIGAKLLLHRMQKIENAGKTKEIQRNESEDTEN